MVKDWANDAEEDTKLLVRRGKEKDRKEDESKLFGKRLFLP